METKKALEGIKVVDFCWYAVGPLTTKSLSDHGATVVKIEGHNRPDGSRYVGPYLENFPGVDRSAVTPNWNTGKYDISINLEKPEAKEIAWELIKWADILAEGFPPGVMKRLGFDYESVAKVKPDIIYFSTCQHGQYGPFSTMAGYGNMGTAMTGAVHICGWPDRGPLPLWGFYMDYVAPKYGAISVLAALDHRQRTGAGLHVDLSQIECTIGQYAPVIMDYAINGRILHRDGNRSPYAVPHGTYPCKGDDRWVAIAVFSDAEWEAFCQAIGSADWVEDPRFATFIARKENEDELNELIGEWTKDYVAEEVEAKMQASGVAASLVENCKDLHEDPQLLHRGHFHWFEHPVLGNHACDGPPYHLSKTPVMMSDGPMLGQHNEYVLKEILHMSDEEIAQLLIKKAITTEEDIAPAL